MLKYAQKIKSAPGQKDGLYWEAAAGEASSPFGPLVTSARAEGYGPRRDGEAPQPFHGYFFRILTSEQGPHAPGGQYDYIINGNMIGGFALVAHPARWGESGIMTFIVNQQGKVYQRDLGPDTAAEVAAALDQIRPRRVLDPGAAAIGGPVQGGWRDQPDSGKARPARFRPARHHEPGPTFPPADRSPPHANAAYARRGPLRVGQRPPIGPTSSKRRTARLAARESGRETTK